MRDALISGDLSTSKTRRAYELDVGGSVELLEKEPVPAACRAIPRDDGVAQVVDRVVGDMLRRPCWINAHDRDCWSGDLVLALRAADERDVEALIHFSEDLGRKTRRTHVAFPLRRDLFDDEGDAGLLADDAEAREAGDRRLD